MIKRKLGKNGPKISSIGFGGWGIGGKTPGNSSYGKTNNNKSLETIKFASDNNVQFFDTSPAYGNGVSENLIGRALRGSRKHTIISTKIGYSSWSAGADFNHDKLIKSLESSLIRLKTDYIDVLWLHSPPGNILFEDKKIFNLLEKFKKDKLINKLDLVSRQEFEVLKKIVQKQDSIIKKLLKKKKVKKAKRS